jgi:hypothetical protein
VQCAHEKGWVIRELNEKTILFDINTGEVSALKQTLYEIRYDSTYCLTVTLHFTADFILEGWGWGKGGVVMGSLRIIVKLKKQEGNR